MTRSAGSGVRHARVRCAIYTRKSSEQRLEQEFNSLARREASEAFINSQRHEGWVCDSEAEIVRSIFRRYAELGSVRLLKDELEARRIDSRSWTSASGRLVGGKPFSRGALYLILQNRISRGSGSPEIKPHRRGR